MRKMNVLVAMNDNFVFPTSVLLLSLKNNQPNDIEFDVYILCSKLSEKSINRMETLNDDIMKLHYTNVKDDLFENVPLYSYFSKETYYRLSAQDLLPKEVERILWLDGDMVINGDLSEFYFQNFDGKLWAAHKDMLNGENVKLRQKLSIPIEYKYCSAGVMLYNIEAMRNEIIVKDIFDYISNNKEILQIVDQDVLNALFYNRIKVWEEPYIYNYFAGYISRKNRKYVFDNCRVIHYCGEKKPWKENYSLYGFDLFWKYAINIDEGDKIYKTVYSSYKKNHFRWVVYEELKSFVRHFISLDKLNRILRRKQDI